MRICTLVALVVALAACKRSPEPGRRVPGRSVETRSPEADGQQPAFPGQTRAPYQTADVKFEIKVVAEGLSHPWSLAFLPDGAMLVTERPGRLRVVAADGSLSAPVAGLPEVDARDQGGLFEVALDPRFAENQRIYWTYAEPREGGNGTALARGRLVRDEAPRVEAVEVIWRMTPTLDSTKHFGGRVVFTSDDTMFVTTGERSILDGRKQAQDMNSTFGKVMRMKSDGSGAAIWSKGHRNVQAAALHPETKKLWVVDHGAKGGDEINVVEEGKDYGWPTITYGEEYKGDAIGEGLTQKEGMEQPIYYWDPVIAPSGMAFYQGDLFPAWKGSLFVGGLAGKHVARLTLDGERVVGEERLLEDRARIRDVRVGPDGAIYLVTDEDDGELLKLVPAAP